MYGCRATRPGHTCTVFSNLPSAPLRAKFYFIVLILLTRGVDIALVYGAYRLLALIF
jgi:hypothetical protein